MSEGQGYKVEEGRSLFSKRSVVVYPVTDCKSFESHSRRIIVPFSGFDGQALAGKGALVFEGELLEVSRH